jgi:hypothetical protein
MQTTLSPAQSPAGPASAPLKVDPIMFEVIRNGLLEATEEMAAALRRSAYSTII